MRIRRTIHSGINWISSRREAAGGVLLYHRIDQSELDPFGLCVSPENFEAHLASISAGGQVFSLHEFMERKNRGLLNRGDLCLTFDDGYLDVFENALPLLEKYEIPATVFVTTGNLGSAFWWDRLAALVYGSRRIPAGLLLEPGQSSPLPIAAHTRESLYELLYPIIQSAGKNRREIIFSTLESQLDSDLGNQIQRAATEEEIRNAAHHPLVTIGAHTVNHNRLSSLDQESQSKEITGSIKILESITGASIDAFSYPFGLQGRDFTDTTMKTARSAGIRYAFAADRGPVTSLSNDLAIPRLWIHDRGGKSVRRNIQLWTGANLPVSMPLSA